jgi:hypothetical protein
MGAGPAPAEPAVVQYAYPSSQAYPVRTPMLVPQPLEPMGTARIAR